MFSKPHFLVIGPYRTGTTWLYSQLCEVHGIKMPDYKELNFFYDADMAMQLADYNKSGVLRPDLPNMQVSPQMIEKATTNMRLGRQNSYRQAKESAGFLWAQYYYHLPRNFNWLSLYLYTTLFSASGGEVTGDVSPAYFTLSPKAIEYIKSNFPNIKIIIILRDPVDREWSNIRAHHYPANGNQDFSFNNYLQKVGAQHDYIRAIGNWEQFFSKEILYLFYDDLLANKQSFMLKLLQFIQPVAKVNQWIDEKMGESPGSVQAGAPLTLTPEIRYKLIERNLSQYHFLAEKFGPESYPAKWVKKVEGK